MENSLKHKTQKKRKLSRNRLIYILIWILVIGGFLTVIIRQQSTLSDIRKEQAYFKEDNANKQVELEEAERGEAYSSSDEFYENKARDEGYVREDETQFVVGN